MSDLLLGFGQLLSVVVIVGGLATAFWHIGVLASKLAKYRNDELAVPPAEPRLRGIDRRDQQTSTRNQ